MSLFLKPTHEYQKADWNARFQQNLLYLGFPSYRYIDEKGILWVKEIIAIKKRRRLCKHIAKLMSQIEGFDKHRSTLAKRDLAKQLLVDSEKMKEYIFDIFIDLNYGLFKTNSTDLKAREFINKYNTIMNQYALSKEYSLPSSFGP